MCASHMCPSHIGHVCVAYVSVAYRLCVRRICVRRICFTLSYLTKWLTSDISMMTSNDFCSRLSWVNGDLTKPIWPRTQGNLSILTLSRDFSRLPLFRVCLCHMRIKLLYFQAPSKTSIFKIESKCIPPFDSKFITDFRNQHLFRTFRV